MTTTPLPEWFATDIDLCHNQLINARAENAATPPASPVKGQLWFDTVSNVLKYFDGVQWTGGRSYNNTVADDGVARPQRGKLNFRSTGGIDAAVLDEGVQDQSSVQLTPKYGPVVPAVNPGQAPTDGSAPTVARSDHSHGAPADSSTDTALLTWWESDQELWAQLTSAATFIPDLPGDVVGGGWLLTDPGSIYWTGSPIPYGAQGVYRNSVRLTAINGNCEVSAGWLCYDSEKRLLGQVKCINQVPVEEGTESGRLISRNYIPEPSMEKPFVNDPASDFPGTWHSNSVFGSGAIATVSQTTEQQHSGTHALKAVWPNLGAGNTQSNALIAAAPFPPKTKLTLSAWVYVPSGNPDVRLDVTFYAGSPVTSLKDQWVQLKVQMTSADDGAMHVYFCGMTCEAPVAGAVAYMDDVMLYEGWDDLPTGVTYFDGDTPSNENAIYSWDGTDQDSTSSWYSIEPSWEVLTGFIAGGDGVEPLPYDGVDEDGVADVDEAVSPPDGTVFFRPFVACADGTMIVDTHEVSRGTRDMTVMDGLSTRWIRVDEDAVVGNLVTTDIAPPTNADGEFLPLHIGPVQDPEEPSDVVPREYVDRIFGAFGVDEETGELPPLPPQFTWSGDPGVEPVPADLGFTFDEWPLFSLWLDTSVLQVKPQVIIGTYTGTSSLSVGSGISSWKQAPETYKIVFNCPADGILIGYSAGSVYALYNDYVEMRCGIWSGVDDDGNGGAFACPAGQQVFSGDSTGNYPRQGYSLFNACRAVAGERYRIATDVYHGGASAIITRDRSMMLYLPYGAMRP